MKFQEFEQLNTLEATRLLDEFRNVEQQRATELFSRCGIEEKLFSVESLKPFLLWVSHQLETVPIPPDESVPDWIRNTADYQKGLFEFVEASRSMIVTAAFYLGESFVQSFDNLDWGLGDDETALCKMPVVQGFASDEELPPLLVLENIFRRVTASPERSGDVDRMVQRWVNEAE